MTKVLNTLSAIGALVMAATPLVALGGVARAQGLDVMPAHIAVGDLDLRTPGDAAVFRQRVDAAADSMCAQAGGSSLASSADCHKAVYDEAVEKLGSAQQRDLKTAAVRSSTWAQAAR